MRSLLPLALLSLPAFPQEASLPRTRNVAILLYEGVELLDFAGPGEVFGASRGFDVFTVAVSREPVSSMGFLKIVPQYTIEDCPRADIIVVPGGAVPADDERLQAWVAEHRANGEVTMSVCNGAALLAAAGVLEGLEVTTHHNTFDSVLGFEPTARAYVNRRFVDHGPLITTAGISAGIDGALHVVSRLAGPEAAQHTATYMEYDWRPEEIAALHARAGILYREQGEKLEASIRELGMEEAVSAYREAFARQSEADRTLPGERRLRAIGDALLNADEPARAVTVFDFTTRAHPHSAGAREALGRAREAAALKASGMPVRHVYACPPCGGTCDEVEYGVPGNCPHCGMQLSRRAVPLEEDTKE